MNAVGATEDVTCTHTCGAISEYPSPSRGPSSRIISFMPFCASHGYLNRKRYSPASV
ncbi:MAG: hypothetical protein J6128_03455 [Clostridia bacterium]|nr:hypothetical protein [Clostridia bacterium]